MKRIHPDRPLTNTERMQRYLAGMTDEERKEFNRKRYHGNREKRLASSAKWRAANQDKERNKHLVRKFGITLDQYNEMLKLQNGVCAICHQPETMSTNRKNDGKVNNLAVDHNHDTGQVRGLLCFKCNTTLSHVEKNKDIISKIVHYLEDK